MSPGVQASEQKVQSSQLAPSAPDVVSFMASDLIYQELNKIIN